MLAYLATDLEALTADTNSGSIFDGYLDVSDDGSDIVNAGDELRTVLSMLDDA